MQQQETSPGHGRDETAARRPGGLRRWLPLALVLVAMGLAWATGLGNLVTLDAVIRRHEQLKGLVHDSCLRVAIGYVLLYVVVVALSLPGAVWLTLAGGFLFGWLVGGSLTLVGATIGAVGIFLVARTSLGQILRNRAGPFMARFAAGFRENALSYLLFLRLVPLFPFWLVNIAPALFDVRLSTYVIATVFGIIPGTFAYAFLGAGLDSLIAAQEAANPGCAQSGTCAVDLTALLTPTMIAALVALGLVALLPVVIKAVRRGGEPMRGRDGA